MIYAAYYWLEVVHDADLFKKNTKNFITLYSLNFYGFEMKISNPYTYCENATQPQRAADRLRHGKGLRD